MRRAVVLVVLAALVLAGALFMLGGQEPRSGTAAHRAASTPAVAAVERSSPGSAATPDPAVTAKRVRPEAVAEREAMRRRILESLQARERAAAERDASAGGGGSTSDSAEPRAAAKPSLPELEEPTEESGAAGNITDRTGNHGHLVKVMNEDLMPLVDECYALARHTQPELTGMLVLDFEIIGDEDIGGVIESVDLGTHNELVDPGLIECVRESILATTLPSPEQGGRDEISLSLRLEPDDPPG